MSWSESVVRKFKRSLGNDLSVFSVFDSESVRILRGGGFSGRRGHYIDLNREEVPEVVEALKQYVGDPGEGKDDE